MKKISFPVGLIESYAFSQESIRNPHMPKDFHLRAMQVVAQISLQHM